MAVETKRGCGYRQVGGLYLTGGILSAPCDRLPIPLEACPVCGGGIKVGRGFTKIDPFRLWGNHEDCKDPPELRPCICCDPPHKTAYLMSVGGRYYKSPADFIKEGQKLGVSKRIAAIPKDFKLGKTIVYLAHPKAIIKDGNGAKTKKGQAKMLEYQMGVFCAFRPQKIEKLVWDKDLKGKRGAKVKKDLRKRGITPVPIPFGDKDHK